jgi:hypothetical protein
LGLVYLILHSIIWYTFYKYFTTRLVEMSVVPPPTKRRRTIGGSSIVPTSTLILEQKLESVQAELDHERSLRILDQRRAQQQQERLEKQVALAVDEAKTTRDLLDQWQVEGQELSAQSQKVITKLRQARDGALAHVNHLELQADRDYDEEEGDGEGLAQYWKSESLRLQCVVETQAAREMELRQEVDDLGEEALARVHAEARAFQFRDDNDINPPPAFKEVVNHARGTVATAPYTGTVATATNKTAKKTVVRHKASNIKINKNNTKKSPKKPAEIVPEKAASSTPKPTPEPRPVYSPCPDHILQLCPPPENGEYYQPPEAISLLLKLTPSERGKTIRIWLEKDLVPVKTKRSIYVQLKNVEEGKPIKPQWGMKGRPRNQVDGDDEDLDDENE